MARLFRAWSILDKFMGQDQVIFNWFVVGRQKPVVPYDKLIENYDENEEEAWYDQLLVNEFLTLDEAGELKEYLRKNHNLEIHLEEVSLPVRSGGLSYGLLLISGQKGFYTLADEEGYKLSVSILGHFDIDENKLSGYLSYEDTQTGVRFIEELFKKLNISGFEQNDVIAALNKIYDETGWCVQMDTRKADRMNSRINN